MNCRPFGLLSMVYCLLSSVVFAGAPSADYALAKKCYHQLTQTKEKDPIKWQACIDSFEKIVAENGKNEWGSKSRFSAGKLYEEKYNLSHDPQDVKKALSHYNQLLQNDPYHSLADDALFRVAILREEITQEKDRAKFALETIVQKYPSGDMITGAKQRLEKLNGAVVVAPAVPDATSPATDINKTQLLGVEPWTADDYAKATLQFNQLPAYKTTVLPPLAQGQSARLVIDLEQTTMPTGLPAQQTVGKVGLLKGLRMDQKENGLLRVVLDATKIGRHEVLPVGNNLIINVYRDNEVKQEIKTDKAPTLPGKIQEKKLGEGQSQAGSAKGEVEIRRVVIDPGHGGKDPGAIGPRGTKEKEVTLQIARKLAWKLKRDLGLEVYLTRNKDIYVDLEKRNAFANTKSADLFISIHANAAETPHASGVQTFYLNNASSKAAEKLADRENKVAGKKLSDVQQVLSTMLQNANTEDSKDLAHQVQKRILKTVGSKYSKVEDLKVQTALFYVLVGAKSPSILVETSFLSNPKEESRLKNSDYQWSIASGIATGIANFIEIQSKYASNL